MDQKRDCYAAAVLEPRSLQDATQHPQCCLCVFSLASDFLAVDGCVATIMRHQQLLTHVPATHRLLHLQALLRASLAAARLNHRYLTTPHLLLGLLSATTSSSSSSSSSSSEASSSCGAACLAPAAGRYAEAEAAVRAMIDGPHSTAASAAVGAAASLMTQSRGLDAVAWCGELSGRAQAVLLAAEQLRQQSGEAAAQSIMCVHAALLAGRQVGSPWFNMPGSYTLHQGPQE
jgi:hypothetical protein